MSGLKKFFLIIAGMAASFLFGYFAFQGGGEEKVVSPLPPVTRPTAPAAKPTPPPSQPPPPTPTNEPKILISGVPFTVQAPSGNWADLRQQHGCEEASVLMAMAWVNNETISSDEAEAQITAISDWTQEKYGASYDTSARDTVNWIIKDYFKYTNVEVWYGVDGRDIRAELAKGNVVLTPVNGQRLLNQYFTPPGPLQHMFVIIGYDPATDEFITNDPGTRYGRNFRYATAVLENALRDYPTGLNEQITKFQSAMIVVKPK